jgi:hypothetical protein
MGVCLPARTVQSRQKEHRSVGAPAPEFGRDLLALPASRSRVRSTRRAAFLVHSAVGIFLSFFCKRSRKTTWKEFLSQHWEQIVTSNFFTVEVWAARGLQRMMVLFFMELATRKVEIAGIAPNADGLWMQQIGRNLTGEEAGYSTIDFPYTTGACSGALPSMEG